MISKIIGYILLGIGFIGFGFFRTYKGSSIPYAYAWWLLSLGLLLSGSFLVFIKKTNKEKKELSEAEKKLRSLKEKGEKIIPDLDHCEFKKNNFREQVESKASSDVQMGDAFYDESRHYTTEDRVQTVIVFSNITGDLTEKFTSRVFPVDEQTLQFYIIKKYVTLYVDRFDRNNYYFELSK